MLYWLLYQKLFPYFRLFRIFRYLTFRTVFASLTALLIGLLIGPFVIEKLREFQIGQYIREEGAAVAPEEDWYSDDGWVLICISILVPTLLWADLSNPYVWLVMLSTLAFGAIGFADDYIKVVHRRNQGLTARAKLGLQFIASAGVAVTLVVMETRGSYSTRLMVPFAKRFRPDLVVGVDGPYSTHALAGLPAVHTLCDDCDFRFKQCGESDRWARWAGDRMHDHCGGRADGVDVCERPCGVLRLSRTPTKPDGERVDGFLRVDGRREYWISLVQRPSCRGFHGGCGESCAGWGDWNRRGGD